MDIASNHKKNHSGRVFSDDDIVQILALDGGGLKGTFTASFLCSIEAQLGHPISEHFDILTGTSTGGLIALGLGRGLCAKNIQQFYLDEGESIFPSRGPIGFARACRSWLAPKYKNVALRATLTKLLQTDNHTDPILGDSNKRLVIPTYLASTSIPRLLKTPHASRYKYDWKMPMWAVGMATSAAPTYLPVFEYDGRSYIDGGVWANNPSLIGIVEALDLGARLKNIRVLNIGTTYVESPSAYFEFLGMKFRRGGRLNWALQILPMVMQANSYATTQMYVHQLLGKGHYVSINPKVEKGRFALDRVNNLGLQELGASTAERQYKELAKFFSHRSRPYTPCAEAMQSAGS